MNLSDEIDNLFSRQQEEWELLKTAVSQHRAVREKMFSWGDDFRINVQYNPARIISTGAHIDPKTIEKRPCFLCAENRPSQQRGIPFLERYMILCNPYPVVENHLTIPLRTHVPQRIRRKVGDMLSLAEQLPDYVVFYNGPHSGASAPDHFHLQAGHKSPVLLQGDHVLRTCMMIESTDKEEVEDLFEDVYQYLHHLQPEKEEPMMNAIAFTEQNRYKLHLFPRKAHRPRQYFEEGSKQLMISPGALDMAGLIITVREEDFNKITPHDIEDIYAQVSLPVI
ncbi:MAG: DUF4922 domain-containing protein [Porphyromonadaceae bacterium]|nr:DUF4922 domain-containing protein [Porphyromonadaceae bacterium]